MEVLVYRPRPTKKINGARTEKKMKNAIRNRDPQPPPRFLWMPDPDNPRFNAITYQKPKMTIKSKPKTYITEREIEKWK